MLLWITQVKIGLAQCHHQGTLGIDGLFATNGERVASTPTHRLDEGAKGDSNEEALAISLWVEVLQMQLKSTLTLGN